MARPWNPRLTVTPALFGKPQVLLMARELGRPPLSLMGPLLAVWFEFQQKAQADGSLDRRTAEWLDLLAGVPGLAAAMQLAGWLVIEPTRLVLPGFDDWVSKKAVKRVENALHMAGRREVEAEGCEGNSSHIPPHTATYGHKVPPVPDVIDPPPPDPAPPAKSSAKKKPQVKAGPCALFDRFWSAYPKKVSKADAQAAWPKLAVTEELLVRMLAAIERQSRSEQWVKDNGTYIPYPATWLNGRRWEDEPAQPGRSVQSGTRIRGGPVRVNPDRCFSSKVPPPAPDAAGTERGGGASLF